LAFLEERVALTGNIAITSAFLVNSSGATVSSVSPDQPVYVEADFTTQDLPSDASYDIAYTVNGLTIDSKNLTDGAGVTGTTLWHYYSGPFVAASGANEATVTVDAKDSVPKTTYADNTFNFTFIAVEHLSYTVPQIRNAYGINKIPNFGPAMADGSGQTIAIVDVGNDPNILTDLDGFDNAMHLSSNASPTLLEHYGRARSILTVYNQSGQNITSELLDSGNDGVPQMNPSGDGEETLDVEWAHAIAPGAKIDIIEVNTTDDQHLPNLFTGDKLAAGLPDVSVVSNSYIATEWNGETAYDSQVFVTPAGHPGVTFLASTGDTGKPGGYPAYSPNVVAVGGTQLSLDGEMYAGETGWSFQTPRTLDSTSATYTGPGVWRSRSGGLSGTYRTATRDSEGSATWTTSILPTDQGHNKLTEVSATWVAKPGNATNAAYSIYNGSARPANFIRTVIVNQRKAPIGTSDGRANFQELGVFLANGNTPRLTVVLSAHSSDGTVVADSIGIAPASASSGGRSQYEREPSYQRSFQRTGFRTIPDVSFDGSNRSGVALYENGTWVYGVAGTSLSCPAWAGLIAIVNQGRVADGGTPLNSPANPRQALQALYSLRTRDFHEVDVGYNGFEEHPGYNEVTGRGSPVANLLVPALVHYDMPSRAEL